MKKLHIQFIFYWFQNNNNSEWVISSPVVQISCFYHFFKFYLKKKYKLLITNKRVQKRSKRHPLSPRTRIDTLLAYIQKNCIYSVGIRSKQKSKINK